MGAACSSCVDDLIEDRTLRHCTSSNTPKFIPDVKRARCVGVYDGDTITVAARHAKRGQPCLYKVRLAGIDAPEIRGGSVAEKEAALAARDFLAALVLNKGVTLSELATEKYGRLLARVHCRGRDLSEVMLERGGGVYAYNGGAKKKFVE